MPQSQYKSNIELKFLARMQTGQHLGLLLGTIFLKSIITYIITNLVYLLLPASAAENIVNFILTYILSIFSSILTVGMYLIFLKLSCNIPAGIEDLFYGFKKNIVKIIKLSAIVSLISVICYIPLNIALSQYTSIVESIMPDNASGISSLMMINPADNSNYIEMYSIVSAATMKIMLIMVVCSVISLILTLPFFPVFYMIIDFPAWSASTILKKSFEVMQGNKLRLLLLYMSFIPSYMLSFFTCGLSLIWVVPYVNMTETNFYLDLMSVRNKNLNSL